MSPTPNGDILPMAMAETLLSVRADLEDEGDCIGRLITGDYLCSEIEVHVDEAMALARGMRAEAREAA